MSAPENDANLCGDMRALVAVLREIRDEQKRCATALEQIAQSVKRPNSNQPEFLPADAWRKS